MKVIVIYGCREGLDPHISGLTTLRQKIIIIIICQMFLIPWAYSSRPDVLDFLSPDILFIMLQKKKRSYIGQILLITWAKGSRPDVDPMILDVIIYFFCQSVFLLFCNILQAVQVLFADPRGVLVIVLWKQSKPLIF